MAGDLGRAMCQRRLTSGWGGRSKGIQVTLRHERKDRESDAKEFVGTGVGVGEAVDHCKVNITYTSHANPLAPS
eukprot:1622306-Rhodomonas_salina.2